MLPPCLLAVVLQNARNGTLPGEDFVTTSCDALVSSLKLPFFLMPLMVTGGRAFQRPRAIEPTQHRNLRFPNLHVTQATKRPQLGAPGARGPKTTPCEGEVRCRGEVVAKFYGCERAVCAPHTKMAFVCHASRGRSRRGARQRSCQRTPMGSALSNVLNACSRWEQPPGIFCCRGGGVGGSWLPPSRLRGGGGRRPPRSVPLGQGVPWGGTAVAHLARACWN